MSAGHYENFPVASLLLPPRQRRATLAIYAFARHADDIADEGDAPKAARIAQLEELERALDAIERGQTPAFEPMQGLALAVRAHALPIDLLRDLLSAFRQDVHTRRYPTNADLDDYCRRSANPVGRLVLQLHGAYTPINAVWSDAICTALQLANFWQDVASDWARGRVYIPGEHLQRFGVTEATIARARPTPEWQALMRFETARTRDMLESGRPLTFALPLRMRLELRGILAGAHRILDMIDAVDGDVFHRRPHLRTLDWLAVATRALVASPRRMRRGTPAGKLTRDA